MNTAWNKWCRNLPSSTALSLYENRITPIIITDITGRRNVRIQNPYTCTTSSALQFYGNIAETFAHAQAVDTRPFLSSHAAWVRGYSLSHAHRHGHTNLMQLRQTFHVRLQLNVFHGHLTNLSCPSAAQCLSFSQTHKADMLLVESMDSFPVFMRARLRCHSSSLDSHCEQRLRG